MNLYAMALLQTAGVAFFLDAFYGSTFAQVQGKYQPRQWIIGDALDELAASLGLSWNFTRTGGIYFTQLSIPGATAASATWIITSDDIRHWKTGERYLPSNVENLGYRFNNAVEQGADLVGSLTATQAALYSRQYTLASYTAAYSGLDQPSTHLLADFPPERATLLIHQADAAAEVQRLSDLRRKERGTYIFDTDAWALAAELGDVVAITYPHDAFDLGKNAVIVGATDDLDSFTSELEVFCQIDGQWPLVTSTQPYASEANY